ncbi:MAG: formate dehydrogenase accessory protein FdhE [Desulfonatronovibrio sp. MSAO_Bac4]|nr:MAG: formate dehydrogenase accessory protein FdhE [Desulfonatronovibrio sp. MSAO_Bac4]
MYNTKDPLKLFEKREKAIAHKKFLPEDLLKLVAFTYKEQLKTFENTSPTIPEDMEIAPLDQVFSGKPLLPRSFFSFDLESSLKLFNLLLDHLDSCSTHLKESAHTINAEIRKNPRLPREAFENYLQGNDQFFRTFGEKSPGSPRTLNFLTQSAITPSLIKNASRISIALPVDHTWSMGHCPTCGSLPYISSLEGKQGARHMHCSFCHTSYPFKRMICPFCQENKSESFEYFTVKEHPGFRVDVCKKCNMYIKTTDFREMDRKHLHVLDDLESLTMDIMAGNQGYIRPVLSAWGF